MESDHKEAYRAALKHLLQKKGRGSQTSTAIQAGVSQGHLNKILSGVKSGGLKTLHSIACALDTSYEDMLTLGRKILVEGEINSEDSAANRISPSLRAMDSAIRILQAALKTEDIPINELLVCPYDTYFEDYGLPPDIEIGREHIDAILTKNIECLTYQDKITMLRFAIRLRNVNPRKAADQASSAIGSVLAKPSAAEG